jgi:hypothetical protein
MYYVNYFLKKGHLGFFILRRVSVERRIKTVSAPFSKNIVGVSIVC